MATVVHIKNLKLGPQNTAFHLEIQKGQNWAIVGDSGTGKTTLGHCIAGKKLIQGDIQLFFEEESIFTPEVIFVEQRHQFKNLSNINDFYYQQRFNSLENEDALTVLAILQTSGKAEAEIEKVLHDFELHTRKFAPILQLSSGEHKRLQLAKLFLKLPQILIFDNPFTGLDIGFRLKFNTLLNQIIEKGCTVIFICTVQEIPDCISHVAEMRDFSILQSVEKSNFKAHHFEENAIEKIKIPTLITDKFEGDTVIKMVNTAVKYGEKIILKNLNWEVKTNEKWLVTGRNGAGKSTLLSLITGDNPQAYSNQIEIFGKRRGRGESIWDVKKRIGYLSPELHAYFDKKLNVFQSIASGLFDTMGLYRKLNQEQENIVNEWIKIFNLGKVVQKPLQYLGYNEQRWVLLARALVKNPPLLIFDEPCQGFNFEQKSLFLEVINQLCENGDKTLIYVSHYQDEIPKHMDYQLIFEENNYKIEKHTNL